jgi:hypothetical protein
LNIDWVIPCRFVEVHDNLATIVGGGIDTFWMQKFPGNLQIMFALRLLAMHDELDRGSKHVVTNRIRNPKGTEIGTGTMELAVDGRSARPEWLIGIPLTFGVQFEVTEEGSYTVEFAVDDAERALPIHVVHGSPPGQ